MDRETDRFYLQRSIDLATQSVAVGGGPFAALIVKDREILAQACNRVTLHCDPSAHAEVEALRRAASHNGTPHLEGCVLYSSCEPCPMCLAAAMWAHVQAIVFAAPHSDAVRAGFDDTEIALKLYGQPRPVNLPAGFMTQLDVENAAAPFEAWLTHEQRVDY